MDETDEEINRCRIELPGFFRQHGYYEVVKKLDESRFDSFGCLNVNESTYQKIPEFWRYFFGMAFFVPRKPLETIRADLIKISRRPYGVDIIINEFADSVFIKGHDGDHLIFVYGPDYDKTLLRGIENLKM